MPQTVFKATFDLPATMARDVGRLIVRYAYLEQYLQHVIYMVLGISAGTGRIVVREQGRLTERLDMLLDLIAAKNLTPPDEDFKQLREAIEDAMEIRNLCAHSTWTWSTEHQGWAVLVSRGSWEGIPRAERARRNKRLFPEGQIIRHKTLKLYVTGLEALEKAFRRIQANLEAQLQSSPQKHP
jgi:hypothetical protein